MALNLHRKFGRRKQVSVLVLVLVLLSAAFTLLRLNVNKDQGADDGGRQVKVDDAPEPLELGWPLNFVDVAVNPEPRKRLRESRVPVGGEQLQKLSAIFPLIDSNSNGFVSVDELRNWIIFKVKEHLQSALRENIFLFTSIDAEVKDGRVSWKEYQTWFLKNRAGNNTGKNTELDRNIKEKIAWDQASWLGAAKTDPQHLNLDEFLTFRHPESSHTNLLSKADEILGEYDRDADETLTWDEYSSIPSDNVFVKHSEKNKDEFVNHMDRNKDGKLDKREILAYVDPRNPRHSHLEAESLIQSSDKNGDSQLSLNEILQMADIFLASKVVDIESTFHDEF